MKNPSFPTHLKNKYHRRESSTFQEDGTYVGPMFGDPPWSGYLEWDKLHIGGLVVEKQEFGATDQIGYNYGYLPIG